MKKLILLAFSCLLMLSVQKSFSYDMGEYITIDTLLKMHPEQQLMKKFANTVSSTPIPLGIRMQEPVKIAVVYPGIQKSNYWRDSVTSMEARLQELGIRYILAKYFSKPSGDYRLQVLQMSEAVKNGSDYIVMSVDNENIKRLVSGVLSKKHPKIMIQNLTTPLKEWLGNPPYMYIGFDHTEGSKLLVDQYARMYPKGAKYLLLYGSKGTVSTLRGDSFESYGMSKGFIPVAKYYTDFSSDKAHDSVKEALSKHSDISFIYACSTDVAIGASKALEELGMSDLIAVNGWGGTLNELNLIKEKKLSFTVMRMNDDNGVAVAEAIKADLQNKSKFTPAVFSGEFVTVTSDMSHDTIDTLIERALRYSAK